MKYHITDWNTERTQCMMKAAMACWVEYGIYASKWADPEGGSDTHPLKNLKNIGFPSNIDLDPLKSQSYQASIQWWAIIGTPAKRHFNGVLLAGYDGPLLVAFRSSLHPIN